ncbi:MBL fold metallo-hydrolase [Streptococcus hillyeri]|uniref:MBL fold metallo-hydrolase n=1 Tax=Streptococcus hillyeri TaxID=2282420 RepID=A0A3L9DUE5_9STRE|nr:MBL fold metallo-hydrolase [Streptococcus hillyeri]RLY03984.1 MBL fold metallo-hydrolase [Streptococcus hillyeri]
MKLSYSSHGQAMPVATEQITQEAFAAMSHTEIRWLGNASILINSRGHIILIDPILDGFDMPLLIDMPIESTAIPKVDSLLISHIDGDHLNFDTLTNIKAVTKAYYAPPYVSEVMTEKGYSTQECSLGQPFTIGNTLVTPTPTKHNWQNGLEKYKYREWREEEYLGYWMDTPDGAIWLPSDSKLLPEHLNMPEPAVILFDFSDNDWHITYEGAVTLANTYPKAELICIHWGSVDAPDWNTFNGNPEKLLADVVNPERVHALNVGQKLVLTDKVASL